MFTASGLLAFHSWTGECYRKLFEHARQLTPEQFTRHLDGFGYPCICDQLLHIVACEDFWVARAKGLEPVSWNYHEYTDVASIWTAYQPVARQTRDWISSMPEAELNAPLRLRFSASATAQATPAGILHHVLTHGFHHKGQAAAMCRILGHPAPETDLDGVILS